MTIRADQVLAKALDALDSRAKYRDQDDGTKTMAKTIAMFNTLTNRDLPESEGWQFMQCLKMARSSQGDFEIDDYIDAAGYAALAGEAAAKENFEPSDPGIVVDLTAVPERSAMDFPAALKMTAAGVPMTRGIWHDVDIVLVELVNGLIVVIARDDPGTISSPTEADMTATDWMVKRRP